MDGKHPAGARILFLTPQLPYPPQQGTAIRNYHLIAQAAQGGHRVGLLCFAQEAQADPGPLGAMCHPLVTVPVPPRSRADRLRTLLASRAPDMAHRLRSAAFAAALRDLLIAEDWDIVHVEGIEMAGYLGAIREASRARVIFDDHNAEYLLQRRHALNDLRYPRRWPAAAYSLIQWRRLARFERGACHCADAVLAVSEVDAEAIGRLAPGSRPLVVPNGVDLALYHPDLPDSLPLRHPAVVFTGKMDYRPNVDGMLWFHAEVWPRVRAEEPEARLYVVGQRPHDRLAPLREDPTVVVTGHVPEVLPYLGGADVCVVPLRIGGGTRLKVLEAMAAGRAIVSTTLGAEGVALTPGEHLLLADEPAEMARAILTLLRDPQRRRALGMAARRRAEERYGWEALCAPLRALYAEMTRR